VAGHAPVIGFWRSLIDPGDGNDESGPSLISSNTGPTVGSTRSEHVGRLTFYDTIGTVKSLVDSFNAQVSAVGNTELVDDLFGAPALVEIMLHEPAELFVALRMRCLGRGRRLRSMA
jgi:hypothetical protein